MNTGAVHDPNRAGPWPRSAMARLEELDAALEEPVPVKCVLGVEGFEQPANANEANQTDPLDAIEVSADAKGGADMSVPMGTMGAGIVKRHLVKKSKQNGRCAPLLDLLLESNDLLLANMDNAPLENLSTPGVKME